MKKENSKMVMEIAAECFLIVVRCFEEFMSLKVGKKSSATAKSSGCLTGMLRIMAFLS